MVFLIKIGNAVIAHLKQSVNKGKINMINVSECCGAEFVSSTDICHACGEHSNAIKQDAPSINVIEMPEMTDEWREKIKFIKKGGLDAK